MGYVREKYTKEYHLKIDKSGKKTNIGAEGVEDFEKGNVRWIDEKILSRINFKNKNVLDLGFGRGAATKFAIDYKANIVIGVDFSPESRQIATEMLQSYGLTANLHCMDALVFLRHYQKFYKNIEPDIVLMLDFIEHVPRHEFKQVLYYLKKIISDKAVLVINTPIYKVDNDIIREGVKPEARDTSDEFEETAGMHCNRYTQKSLIEFMGKAGFIPISGHVFVRNKLKINRHLRKTRFAWKKAFVDDYPIYPKIEKEYFEKAYSSQTLKESFPGKIARNIGLAIGLVLPSIIKLPIVKLSDFILKRNEIEEVEEIPIDLPYVYRPRWHRIKKGLLGGRFFYLDTHDGLWQKEIIEDTYDKFFFKYIEKFNLKNKVIFDIGAHIGCDAMMFAALVGDKGKVYAFEPNKANISRLQKILTRNLDLKKRIKIFEMAVSRSSGVQTFYLSDEVDNGYSSGGYLKGADTPRSEYEYENIAFDKAVVKTTSLDNLSRDLNIKDRPALIKIDVEGAENLILEGARGFIKKHSPFLLIEVHSIFNMYYLSSYFKKLNYSIDLLDLTSDGRCFVCVFPSKKTGFRYEKA